MARLTFLMEYDAYDNEGYSPHDLAYRHDVLLNIGTAGDVSLSELNSHYIAFLHALGFFPPEDMVEALTER